MRMMQVSLLFLLLTTASASDSSDCTAEYNNAVTNGDLTPFCNRCKTETGANPLRDRCSLCYSKCPGTPPEPQPEGHCELDSSDAVEEGINSALFIWASTKRCHGAWLENAPVKCAMDVSSSIQSVTAMANAVANMLQSCGGIKTANQECALASNGLVSATAGLTAASALIADKCAHVAKHPFDGDVLDTETQLGMCVADSADSMNGLFHVSNTVNHMKKHCQDAAGRRRRRRKGQHCVVDSMDVVQALSGFGAAIAAAVSDCSQYHDKTHKPCATTNTDEADCAEGVLAAIDQLIETSKVAKQMVKVCQGSSASRLYLENNAPEASTSNPIVLSALAAALPLTVVLSFVAGKRFSKSRTETLARDAGVLFME